MRFRRVEGLPRLFWRSSDRAVVIDEEGRQ